MPKKKIHERYICVTKPATKHVRTPLNHVYLRSKPKNQHSLVLEKLIFRLTTRFSTFSIYRFPLYNQSTESTDGDGCIKRSNREVVS